MAAQETPDVAALPDEIAAAEEQWTAQHGIGAARIPVYIVPDAQADPLLETLKAAFEATSEKIRAKLERGEEIDDADIREAEAAERKKQQPPVREPPAPVFEGDISAETREYLREKYGDALRSVRVIDPNDMNENIDTFAHVFAGVREALGREVDIVKDPALIGYYRLNCERLSELPYDPDGSYIRLPRDGDIAPALAAEIKRRCKADDKFIDMLHGARDQMRAQMDESRDPNAHKAGMSLYVQAAPDQIRVPAVYDSVSRVTVHALVVRTPMGHGRVKLADAVTQCTKQAVLALARSDTERAQHCERIRLAWFNEPNVNLLGIYVAFDGTYTDAMRQRDREHADTEKQRREAELAQMITNLQLFDKPNVPMSAVAAALAQVPLEVLKTTQDNTRKPPGGDVTPF